MIRLNTCYFRSCQLCPTRLSSFGYTTTTLVSFRAARRTLHVNKHLFIVEDRPKEDHTNKKKKYSVIFFFLKPPFFKTRAVLLDNTNSPRPTPNQQATAIKIMF